jgi:hypothetical protein
MILPVDKGNITAVLRSEDHHNKMLLILNDPDYRKLTTDLTARVETNGFSHKIVSHHTRMVR